MVEGAAPVGEGGGRHGGEHAKGSKVRRRAESSPEDVKQVGTNR